MQRQKDLIQWQLFTALIKQLPTQEEKTLKKDFQVYIDLVLEKIPVSDS